MTEENIIIQKFGGGVLVDLDHLDQMAKIILHAIKNARRPCLVVSAIGKTTSDLLEMAAYITPYADKRELDRLVSVGEIMSASLVAIYLNSIGISAHSFCEEQTGITASDHFTDGDILSVSPDKISLCLSHRIIPVVAGFQGQTPTGEVVTLGRGGSDLTAVALGAALQAEWVELYKDVDGVYTEDPKTTPTAVLIPFLSYESALEIIQHSPHPIICLRAIDYARMHHIPIHVIPFQDFMNKQKGSYISNLQLR